MVPTFRAALRTTVYVAAAAFTLHCVAVEAANMVQPVLTVSGHVYHSVTTEPVPNTLVVIEELAKQARTDRQGEYAIPGVPPGKYHLLITAPGFVPERIEVEAGGALLRTDVALNPELHYTEVVSVSPEARNQFESYQPTSVLAGQDLSKELQASLGDTLQAQPGIASRSFGPAPSRPVIRGLDGDRVLILQDGQRVGDLSSQSGDHGVAVNPAAAARIEIVRGPATLLYGANAIGGLVNMIAETIPTRRTSGAHGGVTADLGTGAREGGAAADIRWGNERWALYAGGGGRRSGDVRTPEGAIDNSQSRSGFGTAGVAWTGDQAFFGGSYGYDDLQYGIPVVEEGQIQLTPRRHAVSLKSAGTGFGGPVRSYRTSFSYRRYEHDELEGAEVGTHFDNDTAEFEVLLGHRPVGRLTGSAGAWFLDRNFAATGEEALSPPVGERGAAGFFYEELTWPHVTLQFGGRLDRARYEPQQGLRPREFTDGSGSVGLLLRPPAESDRFTLAISLARASRHPALEELYYFGPHPGNFAFEIGNPDLESEKALGFDVSVRWRSRRASGEVTYFRNRIDDYVFRSPISGEEFAAQYPDEEEPEFPVIRQVAADSLLQGVEGHADIELTPRLYVEMGLDFVRGELRATKAPLPRIPPLRARGGLRYQMNAFQAGGEVTIIGDQDRVSGGETATDGASLLKLFASYSFGSDRAVSTVTARLENATNELYRSHLSLIKDFVPEVGRSFKLLYSVRF
jgi:iron complex outermembrane receptor protein